jgi:hypothetical protein
MLARTVQAEVLDRLAADDPAAIHSRRDLRRIHRFMGTRGILRRALLATVGPAPPDRPLRILELGAGDGSLLLGVARRLAPQWPAATICLLDRQGLLTPATRAAYAGVGWNVVQETADVLQWAEREDTAAGAAAGKWDAILASLFLHHFNGETLAPLLRCIAQRCEAFVAVEPRRSRLALLGSHLVGALGANAVTREDAVLSVRAGFRDDDIGSVWGRAPGAWRVREYSAGLFSHVFAARRGAPATP